MDVDELKQLIQQYFLNPLSDLPMTQIQLLETNHDQSVRNFVSALAPLFTPDDSAFRGKAADAVADYIGTYLQAESLLSTYEYDGLSDRISTLLSKCANALSDEESLLKSIHGNNAWKAAGATILAGEEIAAPAEVTAPPTIPIDQLTILLAGALVYVTASIDQHNKINELTDIMNTWIRDMEALAHEADPHGSQLPAPPGQIETSITMDANQLKTNASNMALSPAQQLLKQDVTQFLQGVAYDDREIDDLIRAGYKDPATIAAIIKGRSGFPQLFKDSQLAGLMNELTSAQQLQFLDDVAQYQATHPGLTSHQAYNALRTIKMKAQLQLLSDDIMGRNGDPISQAIAQAFPGQAQALNDRLYQRVEDINNITDPFTVPDRKLDGWYGNLTGIWGEWATTKVYYQQGKLVDFSVPLPPDREIDIKINEGGVEKWVEVKNVQTTAQWKKALAQARIYAQNGAKDVILEFPQQGVNGVPDLSQQQLNNLNQVRRDFPNVKFEVRTGANDPSIRFPFDSPSTNWGSYIP